MATFQVEALIDDNAEYTLNQLKCPPSATSITDCTYETEQFCRSDEAIKLVCGSFINSLLLIATGIPLLFSKWNS